MANRVFGRIAPTSPRYAEWMRMYGSDCVPLKSAVFFVADLPDHPSAICYALDVEALTQAQWTRMVVFLTAKFNLPHEEVIADIQHAGVPVLAEDVTVSIEPFGMERRKQTT